MEQYEKYIGKMLDSRYKINRIVGEGGMSVVFEATDVVLKKTVAVKMLKDEMSKDEQSVKRFITESKAVSMLSHKNIVSIYDVSIKNEQKYIVMEYVDGITLKSYIHKKGQLPYKDVIRFSEQILLALAHAHSKKVIHRDIKPQNIILLKDGSIKVADFGIAKLPNAESVTAADKAIGTVYYISPEQASGNDLDQRSDLYSLGVVMYEMATGRLPFVADTTVTIALMQMSKNPVRPREINPSIPIGLEQIILKALEKNPENRFANSVQMLRTLEKVKSNPGVVFKSDVRPKGLGQRNLKELKNQPEKNELEDSKHNKKTNSSMTPIIIGVTIAFFLVLIFTVVFLLFSGSKNKIENGPRTVTIEEYVSHIYDKDMEDRLKSENIYNLTVIDKYSSDHQVNEIVDQNPKSGEKRKVNPGKQYCDLTLTVCRGIFSMNLPDYGVCEHREVEAELKSKYSLVYSEEKEYSDTIPAGYVIRTEPAAGTSVNSGDTIKVFVSRGPNVSYITVPNFTNLTEDLAYQLIKNSGLNFCGAAYVYTGTPEYPTPIPEGMVVKQSHVATTSVPDGTNIYLWVSKGILSENG